MLLEVILPDNTATKLRVAPTESTADVLHEISCGPHGPMLEPPPGMSLQLFLETDGQDGVADPNPVEVPRSKDIQMSDLKLGTGTFDMQFDDVVPGNDHLFLHLAN